MKKSKQREQEWKILEERIPLLTKSLYGQKQGVPDQIHEAIKMQTLTFPEMGNTYKEKSPEFIITNSL